MVKTAMRHKERGAISVHFQYVEIVGKTEILAR